MIKERVQDIKNEPDWKQKMADEWNATATEPQQDQKSQATQKTSQSRASQLSYAKRMDQAKKENQNQDFDTGSLTSEARTKKLENQMAQRIASEVLANNPKLKGVHSKESIKKILEKEALKHMQEGGISEPIVARINEK